MILFASSYSESVMENPLMNSITDIFGVQYSLWNFGKYIKGSFKLFYSHSEFLYSFVKSISERRLILISLASHS